MESVRDKNLKKSHKTPKNRCSYPISDSTDGLTSDSKTHSSTCDIQTTKRKKKKALSRDCEDGSKYKSTNEKRSSDTYSVTSPGISEMVPAQRDNDKASSFSNQPPSVQKHIDVVRNSTADSKTEKFLPIDSAFKDEKRRRRKKKKRSKRKSENSQFSENIKENEDPNAKDSNIGVVRNSTADSKTEKFLQIDSALEDEKSRRRKKKKRSKRESENSQFSENIKENEDPNAKDPNMTSENSQFSENIKENEDPNAKDSNIGVVRNSTADSKTEKFLQIDSALKDEKRGRGKKKKRSKRESENSQFSENIKENEDPNAKDSNVTSAKVKRKITEIKYGVNVEAAFNSSKTCLDKSSNIQQCSRTGKGIISSHVANNQDEIDISAVCCTSDAFLYCSTKKLIVLDLNGLLVDIQKLGFHRDCKEHTRLNNNLVLKRPYFDDFLNFCFGRFHVGVWTSRKRHNSDLVVNYLMGNLRNKLLFCWDQSHCTETGEKTINERWKPLVLKELKKLWNKEYDLPWEKGVFSQSNTLLIDDSPYKSICNPPHTAIFPKPYNYMDKDDKCLGPGGDLRVYLERLAMADDVQVYVREHPFGQKAISSDHSSWKFYQKIINRFQNSSSITT